VRSGAEECGCDPCRNFDAFRSALLDGGLGVLLGSLGIAPPWEVEAYHNARLASGLHSYGAWFHFVGELVPDSEAARGAKAGIRMPEFEPVSARVRVAFRTDCQLVREPFRGLSLVQLDLDAELPWVIPAPEPA
jgi:hypothetical protein